ncbi:hypothetical protein F4678DRAFT_444519 [Xylaria arbuscula]|nr:hypothetical protein F4678DRAFT_444519 [Xylaria arbuscula]
MPRHLSSALGFFVGLFLIKSRRIFKCLTESIEHMYDNNQESVEFTTFCKTGERAEQIAHLFTVPSRLTDKCSKRSSLTAQPPLPASYRPSGYSKISWGVNENNPTN